MRTVESGRDRLAATCRAVYAAECTPAAWVARITTVYAGAGAAAVPG